MYGDDSTGSSHSIDVCVVWTSPESIRMLQNVTRMSMQVILGVILPYNLGRSRAYIGKFT